MLTPEFHSAFHSVVQSSTNRVLSLVQKPSVAPVKPTGSKAAAKSRLAAVKAAMKAKQQAAETADSNAEGPQAEPGPTQSVVFDGGFFQVESPARPAGESTPTCVCCFHDWLSWSKISRMVICCRQCLQVL